MQESLPISAALMTLNEAANLDRCLESVRGIAAEIVIVDSGSTDGSLEIAQKHKAKVFKDRWDGNVAQRKKSFAHCRQPWILCLDGDEALSPELATAIREAFKNGEPPEDGFWINRRTFYLGVWVRHGWYPEWRLRLVRRDRAEVAGRDPHDRVVVPGATGKLNGDLLHYSFKDLKDHFDRTIRYAQVNARGLAEQGARCRWHHLLLWPWAAFFKRLVLKHGWRDGWRGWLIAASSFLSVFAKYAFLLEMELTKQRPRS